MSDFSFQIVTPERIVYEDSVESVTVPTAAGEITILSRHTPIVSLLKPGELRIQKGKNTVPMAVGNGFVEVRDDGKVIILSDAAIHAEDIDVEKAAEARERARKLLDANDQVSDEQFAKFEALFEKELARYKVGSKYSRK